MIRASTIPRLEPPLSGRASIFFCARPAARPSRPSSREVDRSRGVSPLAPGGSPEPDAAARGEAHASSTDARVFEAIARGDSAALALLYDRYADFLFSLILRMVRDRHEAEDLLQETFLKVWDRADRFDPAFGTAATWLATLARNHTIDRRRTVRDAARRAVASLDAEESAASTREDPAPSPTGKTLLREEAQGVHRCLDGLPGDQRAPIELAYFESLSQTEIADRLQQPVGTIKTRMRTGLRRLRDCLRASTGERP